MHFFGLLWNFEFSKLRIFQKNRIYDPIRVKFGIGVLPAITSDAFVFLIFSISDFFRLLLNFEFSKLRDFQKNRSYDRIRVKFGMGVLLASTSDAIFKNLSFFYFFGLLGNFEFSKLWNFQKNQTCDPFRVKFVMGVLLASTSDSRRAPLGFIQIF